MKKILLAVVGLFMVCAIFAMPSDAPAKQKAAMCFGRIKFVNGCADFQVKIVSGCADLRVQKVDCFPNGVGMWQIVDGCADFDVQIVNGCADFTVQYVDCFPGLN